MLQLGQWICDPARVESAASSCLQFGQMNTTSILALQLKLEFDEKLQGPGLKS
jgi:hypothetical protein